MPAPALFINDFTVLDFAFADEALGVQGDSFYVSAELSGELDAKDFLLDFSPAKKLLKALVDDSFDHKLLVPMGTGFARVVERGLELTNGFSYECPRTAFELFPDAEISAPVIEYHLSRLAKERLPGNVREARFQLRSSPRFASEANFRYTHGLRRHDGNCQRLFHGHRNPVEVWLGSARASVWEALLAREWDNAHFATASTVVNRAALDLPLGRRIFGHEGVAEIAYSSRQGEFLGRVPASRMVLTEAEPSIETMAVLAAAALRARGLREEFKVVCYEGLNKGAAYTSRN